MWQLSGPALLGWSLGANDAANVFGTAVSSKMVKYSTAIILTSVFVMLGAFLQGREGLETYRGLHTQNLNTAFIISISAAVSVAFMTFLKLPVSTSQAVVGGIVGISLGLYVTTGAFELSCGGIIKIVVCWILTPVGAACAAVVLYGVVKMIFRLWNPSMIIRNITVKILLIAAGSYGAYALGANNLANVTGPFFGRHMLSFNQAFLLGGLSIVFGVLTFSKHVMYTVGKRIVPLDPFSALIAILAEAVTVHAYALIGVPVSTSQAIVGAVVGIGILKGMQTVDTRKLIHIGCGWIGTPVISASISCGLSFFIY